MARANSGSTLIEVVISVLLAAVMVSAIFSVALTAKSESKITEENNAANQAVRQLSSQLHLYVTSYYSYLTGFVPQMTEVPGPSCPGCATGTGSVAQWTWGATSVSDSCGGVCSSCGGCASGGGPSNCYVLAVGCHCLKNYLPSWFENAPYCARASYNVTSPVGSEGPGVSIQVNWSTP